MNLSDYISYIFKEIRAPLSFKTQYAVEKFIKIPVILFNKIFKVRLPMPYLFKNDYILENRWGKWKIKARSDYDYNVNPMHEEGLEQVFKNCRGIFLDIGAHIGKWSVVAGRTAEKIYAFEPTPETYGYLMENVRLNELSKIITPVNKGVSSHKGELKFEISATNSSMSKIVQDTPENANSIRIETLAIDDFLKEKTIAPERIELVKIDVEGHEFEVLKGMENLLLKSRKLRLLCEILPEQQDKKQIIEYMKNLGFSCRELPTHNDFLFEKSI